jgi:hypothetical protein
MSTTAPHRVAGRLRRVRAPVGVLGAVAMTWVAVAAVRPDDTGPTLCAWRALTGLDCPFCGSTRSAAALGNGDVVGALDHNAWFVLAVLPLAAAAWAAWTRRSWKGQPPPIIPSRIVLAVAALSLAWWVLRLAVPWLGSTAS